MAGKLGLLPGIYAIANLVAEKIDLMLEMLELKMGFLITPRFSLKLDDLLCESFELPLCFNCWIQPGS
jgi:hypothetical protein